MARSYIEDAYGESDDLADVDENNRLGSIAGFSRGSVTDPSDSSVTPLAFSSRM
ncbi:hypothetical protein Htur_2258 [Haloterrigena turkmenica DSM 5511]|uniref:Uncharacterized protein n=1 Tax=Haloterrigena turkmenica (strain ATCC 51198 / DSM 5511 / JCM 9101 / NCIMB 13204 / VKM B-1734 / 4k) TaxID=543526 RepID=D2RUG6_HALTV|nr:hypothetical protein Htur_2258 [Haloterrigena turkmenica DSM 5511]